MTRISCRNFLTDIDNTLNSTGQSLEELCRNCKELAHYKYFIRPIYKISVKKVGTVAATGISFFVSELILHQIVPRTISCAAAQLSDRLRWEDSCVFSYCYPLALFWAAVAVPVMYAKYKRGKADVKAL